MITYEVTVDVAAEIIDQYVAYILIRHIPDLLATGCFVGAEFAQAGENRFRQRYLAFSREDLDRYLADHAVRLREDMARRFPIGTALTREVWDVLKSWGGAPVAR
jgi:Domain of unknown function (DUF4286)